MEKQLEKYASLVIKMGVNLQKGQKLFISAPPFAAPFVHKIVKIAYEQGALKVFVDYVDEEITKLKYALEPEEGLAEIPNWVVQTREQLAEGGAAFLTIYAPNPDLLKGIDPKRIGIVTKAMGTALQKFREYTMGDKVSWSLVSVPTPEWTKKVYPDLPVEEAMPKFWDKIFSIVRVDKDDPIAEWEKHNETLLKVADYLNKKQYQSVVFQAEGTDLTVGLVEGHLWKGGGAVNVVNNQWFNPNMPTEEVFTMPHNQHINGVVSSKKPLNYKGSLIDNFQLTFKDGKVVDYKAEVGQDTLKSLLETDEGACRLGEVALVPHSSPISQSNLIFYNTLFDENASCHLAFGKAYPTNIENGNDQTMEELSKRGVNDSLIHEDFMIGCADMNIDGITKDGTREPIFRNGEWAITF